MKRLDFNDSVYDVTNQYPELISFIIQMGYPQIQNEFLRKTMGKRFTLKQAINRLNLDQNKLIRQLEHCGFHCIY